MVINFKIYKISQNTSNTHIKKKNSSCFVLIPRFSLENPFEYHSRLGHPYLNLVFFSISFCPSLIPGVPIVPIRMWMTREKLTLLNIRERSAIALALISTPEGAPILVVRNLRACTDSHAAINEISKTVGREITVRDSNRFIILEMGFALAGIIGILTGNWGVSFPFLKDRSSNGTFQERADSFGGETPSLNAAMENFSSLSGSYSPFLAAYHEPEEMNNTYEHTGFVIS
jgi:hypothetical protein